MSAPVKTTTTVKTTNSPVTASVDFTESMPTPNLDAERAMIGAMLLDHYAIDLVASTVTRNDLYRHSHAVIFDAMLEIHEKGKVPDPVTIHELLTKRKLVDQPDDELTTEYIGQILDETPTAANAEYYARIVKDRSVRRQLHQRGCEIVRDSSDLSAEVTDLVDSAHGKIMDISATAAPRAIATLAETLGDALAAIDKKQQQGGAVRTGFTELDEITGGLHRGELIVIAARPSVGKTALAINIATNIAFDRKMSVLLVSLEQSKEAIGFRILSSESGVDMHKLRTLRLNSDDIRQLLDSKDAISDYKLYIEDSPGQTVTQIAAQARRTKMRHGLDLLIVDYLQLVESERLDLRANREQQVAAISKRMKGVAKQLDIPVVLLAQLNRMADTKNEGQPKLYNLRESGAIEQDADVVMLMWRPGDGDTIKVDIAKQRDGKTGEFELEFVKRNVRFQDVAPKIPDTPY